MIIVTSTIDEAFLLASKLPYSYHEKASTYSSARAKSFLANRALLNYALQNFYGIKVLPKIAYSQHGKPFFVEARFPFFNISHSKQRIVLAIGPVEQGIDLEYRKKSRNIDSLIKKLFDTKTQEIIYQQQDIQSLFTALWTVKECAVKVTGRGLVDVSSVNIALESKKIAYYLLPNNTTIKTLSLASLLDSPSEDGYLSFAKDSVDTEEFFELKNASFNQIKPASYEFSLES